MTTVATRALESQHIESPVASGALAIVFALIIIAIVKVLPSLTGLRIRADESVRQYMMELLKAEREAHSREIAVLRTQMETREAECDRRIAALEDALKAKGFVK